MEAKHTPGPWRAGSGSGGKGSIVSDQLAVGALGGSDDVDYYGGNMIAESVAQENIALIAAAPELLEALQELLKAVNRITTEYPTGYDGDKAEQLADAAIAKATGSAA